MSGGKSAETRAGAPPARQPPWAADRLPIPDHSPPPHAAERPASPLSHARRAAGQCNNFKRSYDEHISAAPSSSQVSAGYSESFDLLGDKERKAASASRPPGISSSGGCFEGVPRPNQ